MPASNDILMMKILNWMDKDEMHEELRNVLLIYRQNKPKIEIKRTPEVYISRQSTVSEVHDWLKKKNFSDKVIRHLTGMNGKEIFGLKRLQLQDAYGKEEGGRLYSQIEISRQFDPLRTIGSSELRKVLARARAKTEVDVLDEADKEHTELERMTDNNTKLNSLSNRPKELETPKMKKPLESRRKPTDELPPPPTSLLMARNPANEWKPTAVKSNQFVKSRYDPDSDHDDEHDDASDEDGTSTLSRLVRQKSREMLRK